jgi:hypothetical protein
MMCGVGFTDFIHRPKIKILKMLKAQRFGTWLCFRPQVNGEGEEKNTYSVGPLSLPITGVMGRLALSKGTKRIGVLLFSPSIQLRMEAEPASETF